MTALATSVSALLDDSKYTDLEIRCEGRKFKAHRAIVCPRSKVLDKECSGGFLEADTRIIEHSLFSADTIEQMLQFIYRGDYTVRTADGEVARGSRRFKFTPTDLANEKKHAFKAQSITFMEAYRTSSFEELHLEDYLQDTTPLADAIDQRVYTYAVGDYYELPDLKALSLERFEAEKSFLLPVKVEKVLRVVEIVYSNTPVDDPLRTAILTFCIDHATTLLDDDQFAQGIVGNAELQDFNAEFLLRLSKSREEEEQSHAKVAETLQADIENLSKQLKNARAATRDAQAQTALPLRIIGQLSESRGMTNCRFCRLMWNYHLENYGRYGLLARCNICQCANFSSISID